MHTALFALGLLRATAVFEEWTLLDEAPLRESVVVRVHYPPGDQREALLPSTLTPHESFSLWDAATGASLPHRCDRDGCVVRLPASGGRRVIGRFERDAAPARSFVARWPPRGSPGARRVVTLPRPWSGEVPEGWRCPGLDADESVCVDRSGADAFTLRVPAHRSTPAQRLAAAGASATALVAASRLGRDPIEATLAALGGVAVAAACALSVVGARQASWAAALTAVVPLGAVLGAAATRRRASRILGAAALAIVPLTVVLRASPAFALGAAGSFAAAIAVAISIPETSR